MKEKELELLVERYLDGETTLDEEQRLQDYFLKHEDVSASMRPVRCLVLGLAALREPQTTTEANPPSVQRKPLSVYLRRTIGIAASLLLIAGMALGFYRSQNYCEAIVYGHPTSDRELIMQEVNGTMGQINAQTPVDHQLRDMLLSTD